MRNENKTVVEIMAEQCIRIRESGTPLILIDTYDMDLVNQIALKSGIVTPMEKDIRFTQLRKADYYYFLKEGMKTIRDYVNFHDKWDDLMQKDGKSVPVGGIAPGMYILPLGAEIWQQRTGEGSLRVNRLREYVHEHVNSIDPNSPVRQSCILLYGDTKYLPEDLKAYTAIVEEEYPQKWEIRNILQEMVAAEQISLAEDVCTDIMKDLSGFSLRDAVRRIQGLLNADPIGGQAAIKDPVFRKENILTAKKQVLLQTSGLLELQKPKNTQDELAGMDAYQAWVDTYKDHMNDPDKFELERGIPAPKGVLLCGVPGCGKSEAAKILQVKWDLPMVKMNIDQLMGGVVGESERNLRIALRQAEAMAPCILWIDELEKGFSGAGSKQGGDSGTFKRMFGRLLNWMQDNGKACFIFATANDISQLPPEFFRSGRFDALYAVFMPTHDECIAIFREQMRRAENRRKEQAKQMGQKLEYALFEPGCGQDGTDESRRTLETIMGYFTQGDPRNVKFVSGADITKIVNSALRSIDTSKSITPGKWTTAIREIVRPDLFPPKHAEEVSRSELNTQGGSFASLNSIAACYLRLIRGDFTPASKKDQVLITSSDYQVSWDAENERVSASYEGTEPENDYNRALYHAIVQRINRLASMVENNEYMKLSQ